MNRREVLGAIATVIAAPLIVSHMPNRGAPLRFACKDCGVRHAAIRLRQQFQWQTGSVVVIASHRTGMDGPPSCRRNFACGTRISEELRQDAFDIGGKAAVRRLVADAKQKMHDALLAGLVAGQFERRELEEVVMLGVD